MSHQTQQIISNDLPEGFIESPMWVGTGTRLQARKLPANSEQEIIISNKFEILRAKISKWQASIEFELITIDSINTEQNVLKEILILCTKRPSTHAFMINYLMT